MATKIDDLVRMRDVESLHEIMTEDEDWLTQFDAAEGLIELGDRRGYEFVISAVLSDDDEILEVAKEIRESPEFQKLRREIEAERERDRLVHIESARKRLGQGGKVYRYKMVYLAVGAFTGDDPTGEGFRVSALDNQGLQGWEVVNIIPNRRTLMVGSGEEHFTGAYFLLKKEILPSEISELDQ
jgi:hypothetical protein